MSKQKKLPKKVVRAVIFNELRENLLGRQTRRKLWHFIGGGVPLGKKPLQQLKKEVRAECGLIITRATLICKIYSNTRTGPEITYYYLVEVKNLSTLELRDKNEIDALGWFNLMDECPVKLTDTMQVILWHPNIEKLLNQ